MSNGLDTTEHRPLRKALKISALHYFPPLSFVQDGTITHAAAWLQVSKFGDAGTTYVHIQMAPNQDNIAATRRFFSFHCSESGRIIFLHRYCYNALRRCCCRHSHACTRRSAETCTEHQIASHNFEWKRLSNGSAPLCCIRK